MSLTTQPSSTTSIDEVAHRLARVAARERRRSALQIVTLVLWSVVAVFGCEALIDYWGAPERALRQSLLVVLTLAALAVIVRMAIGIVRRTSSVEQLAGDAERLFPSLRGRLRSALSWRALPADVAPPGVSRELIVATCADAARHAQEVDFSSLGANEIARRTRWSFAAAAVLALCVILVVSQTTWGDVWFRRNLLGQEVAWPSVVRIELEGIVDGRLVVARGATARIPVQVTTTGARPAPTPEAILSPARSRTLLAVPGQSGAYRLEVRDVFEPFAFRVAAGDGRTAWVPVQLVDPPQVLDLSLTATLPDYLGGEQKSLSADQGTYALPRGSRLQLSGRANKTLKVAWASTNRGEWEMKIESANRSQETPPRSPKAAATEIAASQFQRELTPEELGDGLISIGVRDVDQLELPRPLTIRIDWIDDQSPRVAAKWTGAGRWIVPTTRIRWNATVTDDHAVVAVRVLARVTDAEGKVVLPWESLHAAMLGDSKSSSFETNADLSLESLALEPGQTLTLVAEATDNDAFAGPKSGRSSERVMRVVSPDELRADWQRRDKEQRLQLEQTWRDLRDEIERLSQLAEPDRRELGERRQARKTLQAALESRLEPLAEIAREMLSSGLESSASPLVERREARIMEPLRRLARETPDEVARALAWSAGSEGWAAARDEAVRRERESLDLLQRVVRELNREEGFQEAVRLLEELATGQEAILRDTIDSRQRRVRELLERKEKDAGASAENGSDK